MHTNGGKNNELNVFGVVHISSAVDICNESIKIPARIYKETEFRTKIQKRVPTLDKHILLIRSFESVNVVHKL